MTRQKPPRIRMVIISPDGQKDFVPPFNRDTQKLREEEAEKFGLLHFFRRTPV
jgi:hypothetical protein